MFQLHAQPVRLHLLVVKHLLNVPNRPSRHPHLVERVQPMLDTLLAEQLLRFAHQLDRLLYRRLVERVVPRLEPRVLDAQHVRHPLPQPVAQTRHRHRAVPRLVGAVIYVRRAPGRIHLLVLFINLLVARARIPHRSQYGQKLQPALSVERVYLHETARLNPERRRQQRRLYLLSLAAPLPVEQRRAHAPGYRYPRGEVRHRRRGHLLGNAVLYLALRRHQAAHRLDYQVVARTIAVRPAPTERRVVAVYDLRVDGGERLVVYPQLRRNVRPRVHHHHVHVWNHPLDDTRRVRAGQVQRQAALPPVQRHIRLRLARDELQRQPPRLPLDRLHLDDVRPHIGEHHPPERACDYLRELQYLYSVQRAWHRELTSSYQDFMKASQLGACAYHPKRSLHAARCIHV